MRSGLFAIIILAGLILAGVLIYGAFRVIALL